MHVFWMLVTVLSFVWRAAIKCNTLISEPLGKHTRSMHVFRVLGVYMPRGGPLVSMLFRSQYVVKSAVMLPHC